jgi:hypothetical protein
MGNGSTDDTRDIALMCSPVPGAGLGVSPSRYFACEQRQQESVWEIVLERTILAEPPQLLLRRYLGRVPVVAP